MILLILLLSYNEYSLILDYNIIKANRNADSKVFTPGSCCDRCGHGNLSDSTVLPVLCEGKPKPLRNNQKPLQEQRCGLFIKG